MVAQQKRSFEAIKRPLYRWARHFNRKSQGRFEVDELANEAWLRSIKYPTQAPKQAMIDYMRVEDNFRCKEPPQFAPFIDNMIGLYPTNHYTFIDSLRNLLRGLSLCDIRIFCLELAGYTQREIGKEVSLSAWSVNRHLKDIHERLRDKLAGQAKETTPIYLS
jgi:ATP/maltotriose-dependent transcriptional regulator MalT